MTAVPHPARAIAPPVTWTGRAWRWLWAPAFDLEQFRATLATWSAPPEPAAEPRHGFQPSPRAAFGKRAPEPAAPIAATPPTATPEPDPGRPMASVTTEAGPIREPGPEPDPILTAPPSARKRKTAPKAEPPPSATPANVQADAVSALVNLGHGRPEATRLIALALDGVPEPLDVAALIRRAMAKPKPAATPPPTAPSD